MIMTFNFQFPDDICLLDPPNVTVSSSAVGPVVEDADTVALKCEVDNG